MTDAAPVQPPPPFVMIRGESIDLDPKSMPGPDGTPVGMLMISIRNPIAAATVAMGIPELDQFIENLKRVRASYTGLVTPNGAGKLIVPGQ